MVGLLSKRSYLFIRFFDRSFKILMRESESVDVQIILVKVILENILRDDIPLSSISKYIDMGVTLLQNICSYDRDSKILLNKSQINQIINLETLFFKILYILLDSNTNTDSKGKNGQEISESTQTELIIGYFRMMEKILSIEPKIKEIVAERKEERIIQRLFSECLFTPKKKSDSSDSDVKKELKCRNYLSRNSAYDLLVELSKNNRDNLESLLDGGMTDLGHNLPQIKSWNYTPALGRRSIEGFVGIYNLSCI